ncbi:MAG: 2-oxo acid dehydrogenase subunit E2 [Dehalococcoidia bacterium]|nr:2-oxo acid dehydrogenase subunit E2 [Dehalococcoidia bacterium]
MAEVLMPQMGADMSEGVLLRWLVAPGDRVERGQAIAEIETDKANIEIEAFEAGTLQRTLVAEGATVPVGAPIAILGEGGGAPAASAAPATAAAAPASTVAAIVAAATPAAAPAPVAPMRAVGERVIASPVARRMAQDTGVDLSTLSGSGPGRRIVRRDVEAAKGRAPVAAAPAAAGNGAAPAAVAAHLEPLSRMRQTIARRMGASKREMPHYYTTVDVDMTDAVALRRQMNALDEQSKVSVNDLIVRAAALGLALHPEFNNRYTEEGMSVRPQINVCIAIALEEGLIAPALLDTNRLSLRDLGQRTRDLAERARSGKLTPEEYSAGTFTISNLGMYGIDVLIPIIQPNQSAILGVGAVKPRAVVRDGQIVARDMMTLALAADHRASDGAQGAQFLAVVRDMLEQPLRLVL